MGFRRGIAVALGEYEAADDIQKRIEDSHNKKIFGESPDRLIQKGGNFGLYL